MPQSNPFLQSIMESGSSARKTWTPASVRWHSRYSIKFAQVRTLGEGDHATGKDYHSLLRERANGVVMNTDDWYELFDVKESDKLYRTSDQRIKIW